MARKPVSQNIQFIAGFLIPTFILLFLSDESRLGPFFGMLLSLAFPVAVELYAFFTGRKASYLSLFAIVGILLIGIISLLGLSEEWLAARRAAFYLIAGLAVIGITRFKRSLVDRGLGLVIDAPKVFAAAKGRHTKNDLTKVVTSVAYAFGVMLLAIGIWSYVFTIIFMNAPTGSSEFNAQYAQLRVLSLPFISLPMLVGMVGMLMYLIGRIEKLTGLEAEDLTKKR